MRSSLVIGFIGGIIVGALQYVSMLIIPEGILGLLLYYSPQIIFFMCIYMSVKIFVKNQPEKVPSFKDSLKTGSVTSIIIVILWSTGLFIALTHADVNADMKQLIANGNGMYVKQFLSQWTMQRMFDQAKMWSIMNFLLGFAMALMVTVIFRLKGKKAV